MAITVAQAIGGLNFNTGASPTSTAAGSLLVVVGWSPTSGWTVSDNHSNTWTLAGSQVSDSFGGGAFFTRLYYVTNAPAGTTSVTSASTVFGFFFELRGAATVSPLDTTGTVSNASWGNGGTTPGGSITPGSNNEIIISGGSFQNNNFNGLAAGSGFISAGSTIASGLAEYKIQTTAATVSANFTATASVTNYSQGQIVAAFKAATGGLVDPGGMMGMVF